MSTAAKPAGTSGTTIVLLIVGLVLLPVILIGGCCVGCVGCTAIIGRNALDNEVLLESKELVRSHPKVIEEFGEITDIDFNFPFNSRITMEEAEFRYSVSTDKASGNVHAFGTKSDGVWTVEEVSIDVDGGDTIYVKGGDIADGMEEPADDAEPGGAKPEDAGALEDVGVTPADDGPGGPVDGADAP